MVESIAEKSELQKILDKHTRPEDSVGGYESFVRALAWGDLRVNLIDGATAINLMILRPELAARRETEENEEK